MPSAGGMRRDLGRGFRHQHDLYQILYAVCCCMLLNGSKGLRAKGRKEMRREKRVLPIGGAFSAV